MERNRNLQILQEMMEKQEDKVLKLETNVFQLANYYIVFQGVIFTAVFSGSSSSLKCHNRWLPFVLSATAAIVNWITLFVIAKRYKISLRRLELCSDAWYQEVNRFRNPDYPFRQSEWQLIERRSRNRQRDIVFIVCMFLFICFAGVNLYGAMGILCQQIDILVHKCVSCGIASSAVEYQESEYIYLSVNRSCLCTPLS